MSVAFPGHSLSFCGMAEGKNRPQAEGSRQQILKNHGCCSPHQPVGVKGCLIRGLVRKRNLSSGKSMKDQVTGPTQNKIPLPRNCQEKVTEAPWSFRFSRHLILPVFTGCQSPALAQLLPIK